MAPAPAKRTPVWLWFLFGGGLVLALIGGLLRSSDTALAGPVGLPLFVVGILAVVAFSVLRGRGGR
ncbi:hypothetical protein [Frondihabitans cladoniiphilus]|uniref:Uncharacterized protein n=1 Tax=Frondihabitans cladoniiphilus TaxID=715785 RepID=A0ABP8VX38_9MICO